VAMPLDTGLAVLASGGVPTLGPNVILQGLSTPAIPGAAGGAAAGNADNAGAGANAERRPALAFGAMVSLILRLSLFGTLAIAYAALGQNSFRLTTFRPCKFRH